MKTMLTNLSAIAQNTQSENIRMIDIDDLHPSPDNFFVVEQIPEFAATILDQGGIKDNLLVTPLKSGGYEIISGHRRTAAVRYLLEQGKSISRLLPCLIQHYDSESEKRIDLVLCNVTARQISDQELWLSYEMLNTELREKKKQGEKFGRMRELLAERLGVSPAQIGKLQNVERNAIAPVREAIANGAISISTANVIAQLDEQQQQEIAAGDLRKVKPKTIKKATAKKVDTSSNIAAAPETVDTSINSSTNSCTESPHEQYGMNHPSGESAKKEAELLKWAQTLSQEQVNFLFNGGWYNSTIKGYLIAAAQNADFTKEQTKELLDGLRHALDVKDKTDADTIYHDWS